MTIRTGFDWFDNPRFPRDASEEAFFRLTCIAVAGWAWCRQEEENELRLSRWGKKGAAAKRANKAPSDKALWHAVTDMRQEDPSLSWRSIAEALLPRFSHRVRPATCGGDRKKAIDAFAAQIHRLRKNPPAPRKALR
jgi:hypothetical protein